MRNGVPKIRRGFIFTLRRDRCVSHRRSQNWASRCAREFTQNINKHNDGRFRILAIRHERWNYILFPNSWRHIFRPWEFSTSRLILEPRNVDFSNPYSVLLARAKTEIPSTQQFSNAEFSSAYGTPSVPLWFFCLCQVKFRFLVDRVSYEGTDILHT